MPGATAHWMPPLPNSRIEQWSVVVIVTGYTLFVTSQCDVIFTFANQPFGEVCSHKGCGVDTQTSDSGSSSGHPNILAPTPTSRSFLLRLENNLVPKNRKKTFY